MCGAACCLGAEWLLLVPVRTEGFIGLVNSEDFFICLHFHFSGIFKGFLDEVMKKYGSLVPLCEKDVMGRLKEVFNEDFSHRCVAVSHCTPGKEQITCIATVCSTSNN